MKFNLPKKQFTFLSLALVLTLSCKNEITKDKNTLFINRLSTETGLNFENKVVDNRNVNIFSYRNFYNGAGMGIGDINNDGLPDVYMISNMGPNKLFLNEGNFKFKDISVMSKTQGTHAWATGVVMVDVNNDGYLDIYVCNAGNVKGDDRRNELFINNKDLTFTEAAAKYGLNDSGFTTHAAFFDYDGDGDLDCYILNNSFLPVNTLDYANKRNVRDQDWNLPELFKGGGDKLLRNDNGKFVDVSKEAGIYGSLIGFGLGVTIGDVNKDGLPDIYVCNDFYERDYLYINQGNGTFKEELKDYFQHITMSSMGADLADINNDGNPDLYVVDMLQEGDKRLKEMGNFDSNYLFNLKLERDFYYQYMQNTLQLNNGNNTFSEIAFLTNTAATDWSWAPLIFDMDNDGYKDIFVTNGIYRDLTDQDFMNYFANGIIQKMALTGKKEEMESIINKMPETPIQNYVFKNNRNLTFTNVAAKWGFPENTFSNGAAYADLDNDGDLDLIINNENEPMLAYENKSNTLLKNNYLKIKLTGSDKNTFGIGTLVKLFANKQQFTQQCMPTRGFQSSVDYVLDFGLGNIKQLDSLQVIWPNGAVEIQKNITVNKQINLNFSNATIPSSKKVIQTRKSFFSATNQPFLSHKEDKYDDFGEESLAPKMISKEGPTVAVGDINKDGLEDIYIGGAKEQPGTIYLQTKGHIFKVLKEKQFETDSNYEDTAAAFFDADGDGDLDLYVGSGGNEAIFDLQVFKDRLYLNDGKGNFTLSSIKLPNSINNTSVVAPCDFDNDGDIDLFVGNRSVPGIYGMNPTQYLLQNNGKGEFTDITKTVAPKLQKVGMVTSAIWDDFTGDGFKDLILVGDWMSPIIFMNDGHNFTILPTNLDQFSGEFNVVKVADLDNDGDLDLVLGNRGDNSFLKADSTHVVKMYVSDFDNNGSIEQIVTRTINGKDIPVALLGDISNQISIIKNKKMSYAKYAVQSIDSLFELVVLNKSIVKKINNFKSVVLLNNHLKFTEKPLPIRAQMSTINNIEIFDINNDGNLDLITSGNNYNYQVQYTRQDASFGDVYLGNGKGDFTWIPWDESGFFIKGQIRGMRFIKNNKKVTYLIAAPNNGVPMLFKYNE